MQRRLSRYSNCDKLSCSQIRVEMAREECTTFDLSHVSLYLLVHMYDVET